MQMWDSKVKHCYCRSLLLGAQHTKLRNICCRRTNIQIPSIPGRVLILVYNFLSWREREVQPLAVSPKHHQQLTC